MRRSRVRSRYRPHNLVWVVSPVAFSSVDLPTSPGQVVKTSTTEMIACVGTLLEESRFHSSRLPFLKFRSLQVDSGEPYYQNLAPVNMN
jgi:hypothetical protein